ncbi:Peptidase M28 [Sesbania bispinosa]|nr:Peptidase M28 [Sesbania bispinosa]
MFSAASKAASKVTSSLPLSHTAKHDTSFSETEASKHVNTFTNFAASKDLNSALQYVVKEGEAIKETAKGNVDVEVDVFPAKSGDSNLKHVVLKVSPKNVSHNNNSILVSANVDSVIFQEGEDDSSNNVAVMLELARGLSQSAHGFKSSVIFDFRTAEDDASENPHSFMKQRFETVRLAIDLDGTLQKLYSSATHVNKAQDMFGSGAKPSPTDFIDFGENAGLQYAFTDHNGVVYHTKKEKLDVLKPGSLQHVGENLLAFLLNTASV